MRIMAEEESDFFRRFERYIDEQPADKLPKRPKNISNYLHKLLELLFDKDGIIDENYSQHEEAVWANIIVEYQVLYPINGFYQCDSKDRLINKKMVVSLMYWKTDKYYTLSFSEYKGK